MSMLIKLGKTLHELKLTFSISCRIIYCRAGTVIASI